LLVSVGEGSGTTRCSRMLLLVGHVELRFGPSRALPWVALQGGARDTHRLENLGLANPALEGPREEGGREGIRGPCTSEE
jgi:hypothetical protein